jgi:hypothetical protein
MVRNASIIAVRKRLRTILIVIVAVIASMSLHPRGNGSLSCGA